MSTVEAEDEKDNELFGKVRIVSKDGLYKWLYERDNRITVIPVDATIANGTDLFAQSEHGRVYLPEHCGWFEMYMDHHVVQHDFRNHITYHHNYITRVNGIGVQNSKTTFGDLCPSTVIEGCLFEFVPAFVGVNEYVLK